jgi:hypothetical protein
VVANTFAFFLGMFGAVIACVDFLIRDREIEAIRLAFMKFWMHLNEFDLRSLQRIARRPGVIFPLGLAWTGLFIWFLIISGKLGEAKSAIYMEAEIDPLGIEGNLLFVLLLCVSVSSFFAGTWLFWHYFFNKQFHWINSSRTVAEFAFKANLLSTFCLFVVVCVGGIDDFWWDRGLAASYLRIFDEPASRSDLVFLTCLIIMYWSLSVSLLVVSALFSVACVGSVLALLAWLALAVSTFVLERLTLRIAEHPRGPVLAVSVILAALGTAIGVI